MSVSFDKKLAELDAYLQMLISENEALDKKLVDYTRSSVSTINSFESEIEGILNIKSNLEKLLSSIKHAIVLLQIAKVSSRASCSGSSSGSAADLRSFSTSTNTPPRPPTRPNRSSKLTSSSSSSKDSSKSAACAERADSRSAIGGGAVRQINDSNSPQQSLQQDQLPSSANAHASDSAVGKLQHDQHYHHTLSRQPSPLAQSPSLLHNPAALHRGTAEATPKSFAAVGGPTCSNNNDAAAAATAAADGEAASLSGGVTGNILNVRAGSIEDEEDDDAFFDADDDQHLNHSKSSSSKLLATPGSPAPLQPVDPTTTTTIITADTSICSDSEEQLGQARRGNMSETNNNVDSTIGDHGSIDWDAMYEEEDEDELGSMEGQGSVIKHLLSQIRIGMDLTKVVLPTFILERRSLLEMYADFFAHPDLFSTIPDFPTPEERMIQLVRWYLSAFHAGRKSSLAKKPYNPILGEIFKCNWQLSNGMKNGASMAITTTTGNNDNKQEDNQQQEQNLTFVAEQVSHHPPVSAFYAENKEKSISCCAHIYTKSKYLGLSVGVHNVGQGVINLKKHNETYTCTFPSAYGRSILTVPWVELGGPVTIACEQTGYKANIEFVMKPFYGGKKHRVTGEILRPNNEPILTIDGEWNGIMYCKAPPSSSEKKIFVDTANLPVIKKHVKPVTAQDSFESRNVWKEVTRALKMKDVNSATAAKSYIEQRQRDQLKDRLEQGVKWETRYFEASGEGWRYSLDAR